MLFQNQKVKKSFRKVKEDISAVKQNTTEWLMYLNAENKELKSRIELLESQLKKLKVIVYE